MEQTGRLGVVINSPNKIIWKGTAESISSKNSAGTFDILPGHANFITMVQNEPIIIQFGNKKEVFRYENAVLSVYDGSVIIYADV